MAVVVEVDEDLVVVDGTAPTISTSRDSSTFFGGLEVVFADAELKRLKDDRAAVAVVKADGAAVVVDW